MVVTCDLLQGCPQLSITMYPRFTLPRIISFLIMNKTITLTISSENLTSIDNQLIEEFANNLTSNRPHLKVKTTLDTTSAITNSNQTIFTNSNSVAVIDLKKVGERLVISANHACSAIPVALMMIEFDERNELKILTRSNPENPKHLVGRSIEGLTSRISG